MVSVICPIYNEEKYIEQFIKSVLNQDYPIDDMELLLIDGMSTDATREIICKYIKEYPQVKILDNPKKIVPCAMNIGIRESKGDIIIRLDAHANFQPNYLSSLVNGLNKYKADNIGTVCKTDVLNKTSKSRAICEVLSNKFGVGNSAFRTGIEEAKAVDTVPYGCWPRSVFERYGIYDERLVRNQDIELNKRIIRNGGKIMIIPDSYCTYFARETFSGLAKNNYENGKWNILTVYYTSQMNSLSLRHFIPLIFVLSLIIPAIVSLFFYKAIILTLLSLLAYLFVIIIICTKLSIVNKLNFIYLLISFFILHISYGFGSLMAIIDLILKGKK